MIEILYQDEDVIAVNKPEGVAAIPESDLSRPCLLAELQHGCAAPLFVVHRLDKEVSGVILFARHAAAHKCLNDQFAGREVSKIYLAVLHGVVSGEGGQIDRPIRQFGSGRMGIDPEGGKPSLTEYRVVERLPEFTVVEAHPRTGRRHQLRVHFYSLGHPIVGDLRYGDRAVQSRFPRLMLHARRISLRLPSGKALSVECPPPASFVDALARIAAPREPSLDCRSGPTVPAGP